MEPGLFLRKRGGNEAAAKAKGLQFEIAKYFGCRSYFTEAFASAFAACPWA